METKKLTALISCLALTMLMLNAKSQTKAVLFEGIVVGGYVNHGAFINCAGPGVKFSKKPYMVLIGFLPSLRIKEDKVITDATKNSALTPNLGVGLTATFRHLALQIPLYYNAKTTGKNGKWHPGAGLGYKF
jgi:hypothetical protein